MRITEKHLQAKVRIVNSMLGFDPDQLEYNTVGSVQLYHNGVGYSVHRVANVSHGVEDLVGDSDGTPRETKQFLDGMAAALRIVRRDGI